MKKLLASSMGSNEKVNSNKLFCTLKISKDLIEYVQKKIKFFLSQSWQMQEHRYGGTHLPQLCIHSLRVRTGVERLFDFIAGNLQKLNILLQRYASFHCGTARIPHGHGNSGWLLHLSFRCLSIMYWLQYRLEKGIDHIYQLSALLYHTLFGL